MTELLIVVLGLAFNAILSCIEMAFVTVSRPHIKQLALKGSAPAQRVLALKANPERVLSVIQIGITLVGIVSAAVGGAGASEYLEPILKNRFGASEKAAEILSIVLVVLPLTYLSVVIGELVPKSLALRYPLKFSLLGGTLLHAMDRLFAPFIFLLEIPTRFFTRIVFKKFKSENYIDTSREIDLDPLTEAHKQYVFNLLDIDKRSVADIMIPWEEVETVDYSEHYFKVLEKIREGRYTRLPVLKDDEVIGMLHAKEFTSETEISKLDWTELIRPILKLGHTERIIGALKHMQVNSSHMALIQKNGTNIGIVTTEDIFEEIVGEIFDEDDNPRTLLSSNSKIRTMNLKRGPSVPNPSKPSPKNAPK